MTKILELIRIEQDHIIKELNVCNETLEKYPKGRVYTQTKGSKTYSYLKFREGAKVITRYVDEHESEVLRIQISERENLMTKIKELKRELAIAERILSDPVIAKLTTK